MEHSPLDRSPYRIDHDLWLQQNLSVRESENLDAMRGQKCVSRLVALSVSILEVLPAIDFDDEPCFVAVEVQREPPQCVLATKLRADPSASNERPHLFLSVGGLLAQKAPELLVVEPA